MAQIEKQKNSYKLQKDQKGYAIEFITLVFQFGGLNSPGICEIQGVAVLTGKKNLFVHTHRFTVGILGDAVAVGCKLLVMEKGGFKLAPDRIQLLQQS